MCGDLDEDDEHGVEKAYAAFLHAAHSEIHDAVEHRGGSRSRLNSQAGTLSDDDLHGYMDGLFADVLRACINDGGRIPEGQRYRLLASQAVVLARLAGFVAAHLDVRQDPLRSNIEAMMAGYARHEHDEADHHDHHHHD